MGEIIRPKWDTVLRDLAFWERRAKNCTLMLFVSACLNLALLIMFLTK